MKTTLRALASVVVAVAAISVASAKAAYTLTILHNNDGESKLTGVVTGTAPNQQRWGGISRFATVVNNLRSQALVGDRKRGVVMISSGDNFLAGAEWQASLDSGTFYDALGMSLIGYDAVTIGNHEFDFGPNTLAQFISGFTTPTTFISANINVSGEPALAALAANGRIASSRVTVLRGERIGIIGATTDSLPFVSSPGNVTVSSNYVAAIQSEVDRLKNMGVGIIIVSSHLQSISEERSLAAQLRDVDCIIAGGGSEVLANPGTPLVPGDTIAQPYPVLVAGADGRNIPIVTTNGSYRYVGRLVLEFDIKRNITAIRPESGPVRVAWAGPDAVAPAPAIENQVVAPVQAYLDSLALQVIGTSTVTLDGRRGGGNSNPALVQPGVRTVETNLGNLCADALRWQANAFAVQFGQPLADIGIQNGGGIRNEGVVAPGNLSVQTCFATLPFANYVTIVRNVTPERLKVLLENAVSSVATAGGRFAQISGFKFTYDEDLPRQVITGSTVTTPGQRVRTVQLDNGMFLVQNGTVVPGAPMVNIATIDFLAVQNGDQYLLNDLPRSIYPTSYTNALRNYIQAPTSSGGVGGAVNTLNYPEGGQVRITRLN